MSSLSRRGFVTGMAAAGAGAACSAMAGAAGASEAGYATPFEATVEWAAEYDVVVIGYGCAGANAAIAAADEGASVLLVEKASEREAGGNSIMSMQGMGWTEDPEGMAVYMKAMRGLFDTPNDEVIDAYAAELANNYDWLVHLGVEEPRVSESAEYPDLERSDAYRIMFVHKGRLDGAAYAVFKQNVEARDNITVWYEAPAVRLIQDSATKIVHGVTVATDGQEVNVRAMNGVVLACGGFENDAVYQNTFLYHEKWPSLGAALHNTGDGIRMALEVGADLWHISNCATNNAEFCDEETGDCTWGLLGQIRGILIGPDGTRFTNEKANGNGKHGHVAYGGTYRAPALPDVCYEVVDQALFELGPLYRTWSRDGSFEIEKGWILKADTLDELCDKMGLGEDAKANLPQTVETYNLFCSEGRDYQFGRDPETLRPLGDGPYYALRAYHAITNTQGGPARNADGNIVDPHGNPIPHLYENGELGDVWSNKYQGACNLGGGLIFGRISGRNAAAAKDDNLRESVMGGKGNYTPAERAGEPDKSAYPVGENQYIGQARGKKGLVTVRVTMSDGKAVDAEVIDHHETTAITANVIANYPKAVIAADDPASADIVAGATYTCAAIIAAIIDAIPA